MNHPISDTFLFGASVYPENQTRDEWLRMLDHFERAAFTAVRLGESAWGHLEPSGAVSVRLGGPGAGRSP
jgi:beta-galactosidase GanA